jgi:hypothetical protein
LALGGHDYEHQPGKPVCAWDDPAARQQLVSALVGDVLAVLGALEGAQLDAQQAEAVGLLGVIAGQDVEPGEQPGTFKIARKVAPDRVISVVDLTPATCTRASAATATATRRTWRWSPRRGWSPRRR